MDPRARAGSDELPEAPTVPAGLRIGRADPHWRPLFVPEDAGGELVVARRPGELRPLLDRVERWALGGRVAVGYVAYEAAPAFDPAFRVREPGADDPPLAQFRLLERGTPPLRDPGEPGGERPGGIWRLDTPGAAYAEAIRAIRSAIRAGDTYQVNYTIRAEAEISGEADSLFASLWAAQPVPHGAFLDFGRWVVCSASPELFFELEGDRIVSRPMKGTARRGLWPARDREAAERLRASEKDRAENLMIVDMVRNDLGRIARPGTVVTRSLFDLERYASVWQLTTAVEARTEASLGEIFAALFPAASITGAPKVRATGIVADLETSTRGVYTGAVGVVGPGRRARFNVAIRTVTVDRATRRGRYGVGGGIVWDSTPEAEYEECRAKAAVLVDSARPPELLETMLWRPARGVWLWEEHVRRLRSSADHLDFPPPEPEALLRAVEGAVPDGDGEASIVRLLWSRRGEASVSVAPMPGPASGPLPTGWAATPVDPGDVRLYHKTSHRETYRRAREEAPSAGEAVLRNPEGFVTELTVGNLVVEREDGDLVTPPIEHGLLPGVYREVLLRERVVREAPLRAADVLAARRVWRVNSVRAWTELAVAPLRA